MAQPSYIEEVHPETLQSDGPPSIEWFAVGDYLYGGAGVGLVRREVCAIEGALVTVSGLEYSLDGEEWTEPETDITDYATFQCV